MQCRLCIVYGIIIYQIQASEAVEYWGEDIVDGYMSRPIYILGAKVYSSNSMLNYNSPDMVYMHTRYSNYCKPAYDNLCDHSPPIFIIFCTGFLEARFRVEYNESKHNKTRGELINTNLHQQR